MDLQERARADRARLALGAALDELEETLHPKNVARKAGRSLRQSFDTHRPVWGAIGAVVLAVVVGLVAWAVLSDDEDDDV